MTDRSQPVHHVLPSMKALQDWELSAKKNSSPPPKTGKYTPAHMLYKIATLRSPPHPALSNYNL